MKLVVPIRFEQQAQQKEQKNQIQLIFDQKVVKNMLSNGRRAQHAGDILFERGLQEHIKENGQESLNLCTEAGGRYLQAIENLAKAALYAAGMGNDTYKKNGRDEKLILTHDISQIQLALDAKNIKVISQEDGKFTVTAGGAEKLAYNDHRYKETKFDVEVAGKLKDISHNTDKKVAQLEKDAKKVRDREKINRIIDRSLAQLKR